VVGVEFDHPARSPHGGAKGDESEHPGCNARHQRYQDVNADTHGADAHGDKPGKRPLESSISADDSVDRVRSSVVVDSGVGGGHHT